MVQKKKHQSVKLRLFLLPNIGNFMECAIACILNIKHSKTSFGQSNTL